MNFVSRGGIKLQHALQTFKMDVTGWVCADLGCSTGGFTDCLLQHGAKRIYAIDTGYGVLDWKLRNDARVVVKERTNAMHVSLPEAVDLVVIDCAWTKQAYILPAAKQLLKPDGQIVTLLKPHYETSPKMLRKGILPQDKVDSVVRDVIDRIIRSGWSVVNRVESPIKGSKGNTEWLLQLKMEF